MIAKCDSFITKDKHNSFVAVPDKIKVLFDVFFKHI